MNEHAGARLENGGLASLALAQAGQGSATVRRRIKRGAEEGGLKVERGLRDRLAGGEGFKERQGCKGNGLSGRRGAIIRVTLEKKNKHETKGRSFCFHLNVKADLLLH